MTRPDKIAFFLSVLTVFAAYLVADRVFERIPHIEDEIAYVWQARVIAQGELGTPSPTYPKDFLVPFVVDNDAGMRYGKYPLGWPALLAVGVFFGARAWVNSILAGVAVWLTYRLGKRLMGETVGLLAALLTSTSPFFLMIAGSMHSHMWGLVLSLAFVLAWWDTFWVQGKAWKWLPAAVAGLTLGVFALSRPFTAVAISFPFALHGLYLLFRGPASVRWRVLLVGGLVLLVAPLHLVWQSIVTGDPLVNPYTLWWPYDKIGFGPGVGVTERGHSLKIAWDNARFGLWAGYGDLFGWLRLSWVFLPFGLWAARKNEKVLLTSAVFASVFIFYFGYWVGSWLYGPRYWFEGLYSLTILSAAGIAWLAGWPTQVAGAWPRWAGIKRFRPLAMFGIVLLLFIGNLAFYLPQRLSNMHGLYGFTRAGQAVFQAEAAQELTPAVVIVHAKVWMEYGNLLDLQDPFLTTPWIFVYGDGTGVPEKLQAEYPDRVILHFYPDEPGVLYRTRR